MQPDKDQNKKGRADMFFFMNALVLINAKLITKSCVLLAINKSTTSEAPMKRWFTEFSDAHIVDA